MRFGLNNNIFQMDERNFFQRDNLKILGYVTVQLVFVHKISNIQVVLAKKNTYILRLFQLGEEKSIVGPKKHLFLNIIEKK